MECNYFSNMKIFRGNLHLTTISVHNLIDKFPYFY
ncbi:unnamed protein product [Acanthoscelides obtectus]|uniref:Uncharacterized protein n=1 Tax=Acanthoscelides obtectus TaxID=200917 RepID=A0A9P0PXR0_ACAOB|nr:unnamed protein product [Acanthoscelides obtectus]CAH2018967.1 unnamed protein product [Acanthoscelides obtectus]CAK1641459.1 hypothetical protein AOBTE_LOCUS12419 [Acanthoscelides obtectus]CAK1641468.1 hypothetical protein AOBTE_LOCUS12423 [Acanthoscelides obtectus]